MNFYLVKFCINALLHNILLSFIRIFGPILSLYLITKIVVTDRWTGELTETQGSFYNIVILINFETLFCYILSFSDKITNNTAQQKQSINLHNALRPPTLYRGLQQTIHTQISFELIYTACGWMHCFVYAKNIIWLSYKLVI